MSHTPGPWTYVYDADGDHAIFAGDKIIAVTAGIEATGSLEEDEANARLIAAAPELYEALKFVQEKCQLYGAADAARERIDAALKKAEGRA